MAASFRDLISTISANTSNFSTEIAPPFRTWLAGIRSLIAETGAFTQTSDTGQIDPATAGVGTTPSAHVIQGYEVYRFNDSLQSTNPLFLFIRYNIFAHSSGTVRVNFNLAFQIASATNGNGGAVGMVSPFYYMTSNVSFTASDINNVDSGTGVARRYYASGGPGRFAIATQQGSPALVVGVGHFGVERTLDASGQPTNKGVMVAHTGSYDRTGAVGNPNVPAFVNQGVLAYESGVFSGTVNNSSLGGAQAGFGPFPAQRYSTTAAVGDSVYLLPAISHTPTVSAPHKNWVGYYPGNIGDLTQFTYAGVNYLAMGSLYGRFWGMSPAPEIYMAMRYD